MCAAGSATAGPSLHRPRDESRDQSHFLFATTAEQATAFLRFPLGDLAKPTVRSLAAELGLAVADKPDSQDILLCPGGPLLHHGHRPVSGHRRALGGDIVDLDGRVLGRHVAA